MGGRGSEAASRARRQGPGRAARTGGQDGARTGQQDDSQRPGQDGGRVDERASGGRVADDGGRRRTPEAFVGRITDGRMAPVGPWRHAKQRYEESCTQDQTRERRATSDEQRAASSEQQRHTEPEARATRSSQPAADREGWAGLGWTDWTDSRPVRSGQVRSGQHRASAQRQAMPCQTQTAALSLPSAPLRTVSYCTRTRAGEAFRGGGLAGGRASEWQAARPARPQGRSPAGGPRGRALEDRPGQPDPKPRTEGQRARGQQRGSQSEEDWEDWTLAGGATRRDGAADATMRRRERRRCDDDAVPPRGRPGRHQYGSCSCSRCCAGAESCSTPPCDWPPRVESGQQRHGGRCWPSSTSPPPPRWVHDRVPVARPGQTPGAAPVWGFRAPPPVSPRELTVCSSLALFGAAPCHGVCEPARRARLLRQPVTLSAPAPTGLSSALLARGPAGRDSLQPLSQRLCGVRRRRLLAGPPALWQIAWTARRPSGQWAALRFDSPREEGTRRRASVRPRRPPRPPPPPLDFYPPSPSPRRGIRRPGQHSAPDGRARGPFVAGPSGPTRPHNCHAGRHEISRRRDVQRVRVLGAPTGQRPRPQRSAGSFAPGSRRRSAACGSAAPAVGRCRAAGPSSLRRSLRLRAGRGAAWQMADGPVVRRPSLPGDR